MFLSIVIPIYNDEKFLAECLDSCLAQDIPYDDYEIICVDDGSTDRTAEILEDYAKRYPNIVLIFKEHGVGHGRDIGMERAKGEYLWFVDHDDLLTENVLAELKDEANRSKSDRIVFSCFSFHDELTADEKRKKAEKKLKPNDDAMINSVVWTSVIRKAFLIENDIMPHSKRLGDKRGWAIDRLFIYEIIQNDANESKLIGVPFYYYRRHAGSEASECSQAATDARFFGKANVATIMFQDYYDSLGINMAHCKMAATSTMDFVYRCTNILVRCPAEEFKEKKKYLEENGLFPLKTLKESKYSRKYFLNEENGKSKIHNLLRYYSTYSDLALFALTVPHRLQRLKIKLSRTLRKNKLFDKLLDIKNKLLGR